MADVESVDWDEIGRFRPVGDALDDYSERQQEKEPAPGDSVPEKEEKKPRKKKSKASEENRPYGFYLPDDLNVALTVYSTYLKKDRSAVVREALEKFLPEWSKVPLGELKEKRR